MLESFQGRESTGSLLEASLTDGLGKERQLNSRMEHLPCAAFAGNQAGRCSRERVRAVLSGP